MADGTEFDGLLRLATGGENFADLIPLSRAEALAMYGARAVGEVPADQCPLVDDERP